MRIKLFAIAATLLMLPAMSFAEDRIWTGAMDSDFLTPANWDTGIPTSDLDLVVVNGGDNLPVVIPESAEEITIGGFQLGTSGETGGHIVQNGGTLIVAPFLQDGLDTSFEFKSHIGDKGTLDSSYVMNNDAVMLYDGPQDSGGFGFGGNGENEFDLEVGAGTGTAVGRLELHDNSVLRIADDLKIGAEENGNGHVLLDGNAIVSAGSGISVSEGVASKGVLEVRGNALMVSGNSAGPGEADTGYTDEGYLTLSVREATTADVTIADTGKLYARTLQQRDGVSNMTIEGSGEFHVFDVFNYASPDLGTATIADASANPTSHVASAPTAEMTFTIKDNGIMSVDSDLQDSPWSGLALSGGSNGGGNGLGGKTLIEVRDSGSLTIQQDLHMTLGDGETAESTLKVVGPDASVDINGNLYMALSPDGLENIGLATLHAVISGNSHSTINVAGDADIANGLLAIELDGYSPRGGEVFTLLEAGSVMGDAFLETDFTMGVLPEGLEWDLSIDSTSIVLSISGMLEGLFGDFDGSNALDVADLDSLVSNIGSSDLGFDVNGDAALTSDDIAAWLTLKSDADGVTYFNGDTDLDGAVTFADFLVLSGSFGNTDTAWSQGNFDGADGTAFADFLALSANFGQGNAGAESVPEPATGCFLFVIGLFGLHLGRRSGR